MAEFHLQSHPDFAPGPVNAITVTAERVLPGHLALSFLVMGAIDDIAWPAAAPPVFTDELWQHSCFEAFVIDGAGYTELNASPSSAWAAYRFDDHRAGMRRADDVAVDGLGWSAMAEIAALGVSLRLPHLTDLPVWRLGLSTIIEAKDGSKSYWALAHASGPPDFHNPDCFIATLPAPGQP